MSNGWNGADPTQVTDPASYELGTEYVANSDIQITAVRVWEGASPGSFANRQGRIWSTGGSLLGSASMPTNLPAGWSVYTLTTPVNVSTGTHVVVSYSTGGNYGALNHALDSAVPSADGLVTAVAAASGAHGNGAFTTSPTTYPNTPSSQNTFYGIDIVYGAAGSQPPIITGMTVTANALTATATVNATDHNGNPLVGANYKFDWGDGTTTSGSASTATHTYTAAGQYAVLCTVTDAFGLTANKAEPITVAPAPSGIDPNALINAIVSAAQSTGQFTDVAGHEPASLPATGMSAAVWMQGLGPARKVSGLAGTAARIEYRMRIYTPMLTGAMDSIDPAMTAAASQMIGILSGDFTLVGLVFEVDLLGANGAPLAAKADYYKQGDQFYRIYDLTIPLVVDNAWTQAAVGGP
jgi:plastocyanin